MTGLVGITGKAGSGKSTAAQVLLDAGWVRVKFADPLKDMLRAFYRLAGLQPDIIERKIEGDLKEVPCDLLCGQTPRWAMQSLGTDWGRKMIGVDLWLSIARRRIALAMAAGFDVVVDDVRFEDEADMIRELGGLVIGLERGDGAGGHVSEAGVAPDIRHVNDGTLDELRGFVRYVFLMAGE